MKISGYYSHKDGEGYIRRNHPLVLQEVEAVIAEIDAESCRLKLPKWEEVRRAERAGITHFYSPLHLNALFDYFLFKLGWELKPRIKTNDPSRFGYREIDYLKEKVGVEVQIGKYSFLTYDIVAKMVIFHKLGVIDCGVEICPMASMLPHMSSGIGSFEQVTWDLQIRGVADIDIPVLVLGFESEQMYAQFDVRETRPLFDFMGQPTVIRHRHLRQGLSVNTLKRVAETGIVVELDK